MSEHTAAAEQGSRTDPMSPGRDVSVSGTRLRGVTRFASLVSAGFEPRNWMMFLAPVLGWHADRWAGAGWGVFAAGFTAVLPTLVLAFGAWRGYWFDRGVRRRQERLVAAPGVLAPVVVGTVLLYVLGAPGVVGALVAAMLTVLLVLLAITAAWKVSVHSAVAGAAVAVLVSTYGAWALAAGVVVPVIGWSRVRLRCHTAAQVVVGALVGAGVGGAAFCFLR